VEKVKAEPTDENRRRWRAHDEENDDDVDGENKAVEGRAGKSGDSKGKL